MSLLSALFLIFLVLKLVGIITWSWLAVFAPLIIEVILIIILALSE